MADSVRVGGKKGRKIGRNVKKYGQWQGEHRFTESKEKRGCGPLGYYNRLLKARESHAYAPYQWGKDWPGNRVYWGG